MAASQQRIIVVGGGIIGASIAYHLAVAGTSPMVFDCGPDDQRATPASWAWINASWGNPKAYFRLRMHSIGEWHRLGRELPSLPLKFCGSLTYDMPEAALLEYVERHGDWGYRIRLVEADEIARLVPLLRERPRFAAKCDDEGRVEPAEATQLLLAAAAERGASINRTARVARLRVDSGRVTGVDTGDGAITADEVIVAAGIGSPQLLASAGIDFPLDSPPGLLAHTAPLPPVLDRLIVSPHLELRQTAAGRLLAAFDFAGNIPAGLAEPGVAIIERVNAMLRLAEPVTLSHTTMGRRPTPKDGFPAIGRVGGLRGLYLAVMHSGVTLAPAVGAFTAEELISGRRDPLLEPYAPDRFFVGAIA